MSKYAEQLTKRYDDAFIFDRSVLKVKGSGFGSGAFVESTPNLIRIWRVRFPLYHGESNLHLTYSDVYWEGELRSMPELSEVGERFRGAFESIKEVDDDEFVAWVSCSNIDELHVLRCQLFHYLNNKEIEGALRLATDFKTAIREDCQFSWWIDTVAVWETFLSDQSRALLEIQERRELALRRLEISKYESRA